MSEKIKIIEVPITALRITGEDEWRNNHIAVMGDSVYRSPEYAYLSTGDGFLLLDWLGDYAQFRMGHLTAVKKHLKEFGQLKPILIYKDMRICSGHKRSAGLASLGKETILATIVPDSTKL